MGGEKPIRGSCIKYPLRGLQGFTGLVRVAFGSKSISYYIYHTATSGESLEGMKRRWRR